MFKHFASCLGTWGENCAYFLACYCLLLRLLGVGGGGGERIITFFVQRSWFQPCFKICCCMMFARGGGWEGGEDSNVLCSTHTESTTPVTRNRVQHGTEDVLPKVVVGHDMMEKRRIGQGISLRGHNRTCYKIATHDTSCVICPHMTCSKTPNSLSNSSLLHHGMSHDDFWQYILSPMLNPVSCDRRGTFCMFPTDTCTLLLTASKPPQAETATSVAKTRVLSTSQL